MRPLAHASPEETVPRISLRAAAGSHPRLLRPLQACSWPSVASPADGGGAGRDVATVGAAVAALGAAAAMASSGELSMRQWKRLGEMGAAGQRKVLRLRRGAQQQKKQQQQQQEEEVAWPRLLRPFARLGVALVVDVALVVAEVAKRPLELRSCYCRHLDLGWRTSCQLAGNRHDLSEQHERCHYLPFLRRLLLLLLEPRGGALGRSAAAAAQTTSLLALASALTAALPPFRLRSLLLHLQRLLHSNLNPLLLLLHFCCHWCPAACSGHPHRHQRHHWGHHCGERARN